MPTEAEWEYAARGALEGKKYVWGDNDRPILEGAKQANVIDESFVQANENYRKHAEKTGFFAGYQDGYFHTSPVGSFAPNGYGLYDMAGNVWEWCCDKFKRDYYRYSPSRDPEGPEEGYGHVMRGGSFFVNPEAVRVACRSWGESDVKSVTIGFRIIREVEQQ